MKKEDLKEGDLFAFRSKGYKVWLRDIGGFSISYAPTVWKFTENTSLIGNVGVERVDQLLEKAQRYSDPVEVEIVLITLPD